MVKRDTYLSYELVQITPVTDYQAIYCFDGRHQAFPIRMLGLARITEKPCRGSHLPEPYETWTEIVALEHSRENLGWGICEKVSNYAGLLEPGEDIGDFSIGDCECCQVRSLKAQKETH
jgi:hypothetical protein